MAEIQQKKPLKRNLLEDIGMELGIEEPNDLPNDLPNNLPNDLPNKNTVKTLYTNQKPEYNNNSNNNNNNKKEKKSILDGSSLKNNNEERTTPSATTELKENNHTLESEKDKIINAMIAEGYQPDFFEDTVFYEEGDKLHKEWLKAQKELDRRYNATIFSPGNKRQQDKLPFNQQKGTNAPQQKQALKTEYGNAEVNKILKVFKERGGMTGNPPWERKAAYTLATAKKYNGNIDGILEDYFDEQKEHFDFVKYLPVTTSPSEFHSKFSKIENYFKNNRKYNIVTQKSLVETKKPQLKMRVAKNI